MNLSRRGFLVSLSAAVAALTIKTLVPSAVLDPVAILQGTYEPEALLWTPDDPAERLILPERVRLADDRGLMHMTNDVLRAIEHELGPGFHAMLAPPYLSHVGDQVQVRGEPPPFVAGAWDQDITTSVRPVMLNQQWTTECRMSSLEDWRRRGENYPWFQRTMLGDAGRQLAGRIRKKRINVFGQLPLPRGLGEGATASSDKSGIAVRGMQFYDIEFHHMILRFDILGGHA